MAIGRRGFMKSATIAGSLLALGASGGEASPNSRINVAIVGCRNRGSGVMKSMLQTGLFNVVTLCDCDIGNNSRGMLTFGKYADTDTRPKVERDFRKVLDDKEVEAVVVATPDHWHALMTVMALDAGKHVYVEKPASFNIAEGKAMVAAQERHPELTVLVGSQQRSGQHFQDARTFLHSGDLGKIGFCRAFYVNRREVLPIVPDSEPPEYLDYPMWLGPAPERPYNKNRSHYNWRFIRDYGTGEMGNWGAHWLDIIRWFLDLDFPLAVTAVGGTHVVYDAKEWPDTQTVLYEYPDLTVLWEHRQWTEQCSGAPCEIHGEKGSLMISRGGWSFHPADGDPVYHDGSEMDMAHAVNFADCIRGDSTPSAPIQEGYKSAVLCHLGNISATVKRRIEFDSETQSIVHDEEAKTLEMREYRPPWRLPELS